MKKSLYKVLKQGEYYVKNNAPTILTVLGVAGVVGTSVSAVKSSKRYELAMADSSSTDEELTTMDKLKVAIPSFAPTILIGAGTISCIVGSNILNKKQQATLTSAYMALDAAYKEYRAKAKELYGEDADDKIIAGIAKDNCEVDENTLMYGEKRLFFEPVSRSYFEATIAQVQKGEYLLNRELAQTGYAKINDFLKFLGVEKTDLGDIMGWSTHSIEHLYTTKWIDFKHERIELEDGLECYIIKYPEEPRLDFMDY